MKYHPLSLLFPKLSEFEIQELAADIRSMGLKHKILLYDGQILDGRHRYEACQRIKFDMTDASLYEVYRGADPRGEVISRNLRRRQLNDLERSMVAASLTAYGPGRPKLNRGNSPTSTKDDDMDEQIPFTAEEAAAMFNVTKDQIREVKPIVKKGSKALQEAVKSGQVPVSKAAAVVDLPKAQQLSAARGNPMAAYFPIEPARIEVDPLDLLVMRLEAWFDEWSKAVPADVTALSAETFLKKVKSLAKEIKSNS